MPNRARIGSGEHPEARGCADEREPLDRHRDGLRLRPVAEPDVDLVVLHRGIEKLLDNRAQPWISSMKRMSPLAQVGERAHEIARLLQRRPGRRANVDAELARDELRERGLAESRRPVEERVVERLAAAERGLDVDRKAVLHLLLADELGEPLRAERQLDDRLFGHDFGGGDLGAGHGLGHTGVVSWKFVVLSESRPFRPLDSIRFSLLLRADAQFRR